MSLEEFKLKDSDISEKGVVAAPDKLTGTAQQNKMLFDRLIREAVKSLFNGLIDALEESGVENAVVNIGNAKFLRRNGDALEISEDGETYYAYLPGVQLVFDDETMPVKPVLEITGNAEVESQTGKNVLNIKNLINTETETPISGLLKGSGGTLKQAIPGVDYAEATDLPDGDIVSFEGELQISKPPHSGNVYYNTGSEELELWIDRFLGGVRVQGWFPIGVAGGWQKKNVQDEGGYYESSAIEEILQELGAAKLNPAEKTEAMTQAIGKDETGQLWTEPGGGGISTEARTLLITVLKNALYETDQRDNIDALNEALKQGRAVLIGITASYSAGTAITGASTADLDIVVTGSYSDGTAAVIESGYTLSPATLAEGSNTITVTFGGFTATVNVTAITPSEDPVSITATYSGEGEYVGTVGSDVPLTVKAQYEGGTETVVTEYTVTGSITQIGDNTLTVTYGDLTTTVTVTGIATPVVLESITAVFNDESAEVGTNAEDLDITVTAHYSDSSTAVVEGWGIDGTVAEGTNTFTISYGGKTCTVTVIGVYTPVFTKYDFDMTGTGTVSISGFPLADITKSYTLLFDYYALAALGSTNKQVNLETIRNRVSDGTSKTLSRVVLKGNNTNNIENTSGSGISGSIGYPAEKNTRYQWAISYDAETGDTKVWAFKQTDGGTAEMKLAAEKTVDLAENADVAGGVRVHSYDDYANMVKGNWHLNAIEIYLDRTIDQTAAYAFFNRPVEV